MTLLICLPLILVIGGLTARRWFIAARQDIRSIESHRSNLHHLEHLAPDADQGAGSHPGSAHVRVVGPTGVPAAPAVRPMTWGRVDGRPPAARPAWHAPREDPVPTRYERARQAARRVEADERPRILITDEAVAGIPDPEPVPARGRPPVPAPALPPAVARSEPEAAGSLAEVVVIDDLGTGGEPAAGPSTAAAGGDTAAAAPAAAAAAGPAAAAEPAAASGRRRDRSRPPRTGRSVRRRRVALASAAGLVVVAAGAGAAVVELHPFSPSAGHHVASPHHRAGPAPAGASGTSAPTAGAAPTTTVAPALTATSSTSTEALYTVASGQLQLSLTASGSCWVELRAGSPTGSVMYEGVMQPGATQSFSAAGGVWLRLGDPGGVQLRINGSAIELPSVANPFNVTVATA